MSPRFPPDPDEILDRLYRIIRPPIPPWMWMKEREEGEFAPRRRKAPALTGSRMVWPYRIVWRQGATGRGVIKVLKEEKSIGTISYTDPNDRSRLVELLEDIVRGIGRG